MKIALIQISQESANIADVLQRQLDAQPLIRTDVGTRWNDFDAFIFLGAMGICVRTIAPYITDKHKDPAVVCIDSLGLHVVSVLSGHIRVYRFW